LVRDGQEWGLAKGINNRHPKLDLSDASRLKIAPLLHRGFLEERTGLEPATSTPRDAKATVTS
jgi:hypothetical protein